MAATTSLCSLASLCTDASRLAACSANSVRSVGSADQPSAVGFVFRANPVAGVPAVHHGPAAANFMKGRKARQVLAMAAAGSTLPDKTSELVDKQKSLTVGDVMTSGKIVTVKTSTTVDEALENLVENRITGMPVVDDKERLIGIVSDYDLLALDDISGKPQQSSTGLFPEATSTWKAFKELQKMIIKTKGQLVGDVMTPSPLSVRPMTNLEDAARILLDSRHRRLPVVDEDGKLVGIITRGNVIQAALEMKRKMEAHLD